MKLLKNRLHRGDAVRTLTKGDKGYWGYKLSFDKKKYHESQGVSPILLLQGLSHKVFPLTIRYLETTLVVD